MDFIEQLEIVAICTPKKHFFDSHTFKADIGQHFDKSDSSGVKHNLATLVTVILGFIRSTNNQVIMENESHNSTRNGNSQHLPSGASLQFIHSVLVL